MPTRPNLLGTFDRPGYTSAYLPVLRPHYPASVARALHALAESRPTPDQYAREKARILGGHE